MIYKITVSGTWVARVNFSTFYIKHELVMRFPLNRKTPNVFDFQMLSNCQTKRRNGLVIAQSDNKYRVLIETLGGTERF